jgi:hypothetical protein
MFEGFPRDIRAGPNPDGVGSAGDNLLGCLALYKATSLVVCPYLGRMVWKFSAGLHGGRGGPQPRKKRRDKEEGGLERNHVDSVLVEWVE